MTLLNTVCNLGGNWPSTLALWSVDTLTWKSCQGSSADLHFNDCRNTQQTQVGSHHLLFLVPRFMLCLPLLSRESRGPPG